MGKRSWALLGSIALVTAACGGGEGGAAVDTTAAETAVDTTEAMSDTTEPMAETTEPMVDTTAAETTETTAADAGADTTAGGGIDYGDGGSAATGGTVEVADSPEGEIVVDGEGYALYLFVPDGQGESTCYDDCEANWPPVTAPVETGAGVDGSLLGTTERTDGSEQVTYGGWPLYYFANDLEPGDINGQGANDVWFLVSPDGEGIGMP